MQRRSAVALYRSALRGEREGAIRRERLRRSFSSSRFATRSSRALAGARDTRRGSADDLGEGRRDRREW